MKKSLLVLAVMAIFTVKADYLYWMVTGDPGQGQNFIGEAVDFTQWDNAKLYYGGDSFTGGTVAGSMTKDTAQMLDAAEAYAYASISGYNETTTFFIELYSGTTYLGRAAGSYSDVARYIFASNSMAPVGMAWVPTSYAVPEPTSGLLFLVGGMLLGLKRRRQKV